MRTGAGATLTRVIVRDNEAAGLLDAGGTITGMSVLHDCNAVAQPLYQADGAVLIAPELDEASRCGCQRTGLGSCRPTTSSSPLPSRVSDPASEAFAAVLP
jgi:hypothetical protein